MKPLERGRRRKSAWHRIIRTTLRALRSTVVIATVALLIAVIRNGPFQWNRFWRVAAENRVLIVMIFFGVLVWDYWFDRMRRFQAIERSAHATVRGRDEP